MMCRLDRLDLESKYSCLNYRNGFKKVPRRGAGGMAKPSPPFMFPRLKPPWFNLGRLAGRTGEASPCLNPERTGEASPCLAPCFTPGLLHKYSVMLLLMLFMAIMVLPGCSNQSGDDVTLNVNECADGLQETIAFQDTLTAISDQMITTIYRISAEDVAQQQVYVSTGATAEEIAVFEAVDTDAAQRIETAVWQRVADQKAGFEDYLPAELPKLADPFVLVKGKYVILCVSDHNEEVKTELDKLFK